MEARKGFAPEGTGGVVSAILKSGRFGKKKQGPDERKVDPTDADIRGGGVIPLRPNSFGRKNKHEPNVRIVTPEGVDTMSTIPPSDSFGIKKQYGADRNFGSVTCRRGAPQNTDINNGKKKSGPLPSLEQDRQGSQALPSVPPPKGSRLVSPPADGTTPICSTSHKTDSHFCSYFERRLLALQKEEPLLVPVAHVENWLSGLRAATFRSSTALHGGDTMPPRAAIVELYAPSTAGGYNAAAAQYDNNANLADDAATAALALRPRTKKVISSLEIAFIVSSADTKAGTEGEVKTMPSRYIRDSGLEVIIEGSLARIWGEKEAVDEALWATEQLGRVSWGSEVPTRWYWMQEEGSDDLSLLHPMRVETSDILEEAFSCRDVVRYQVNRNSYEADFTRMKQTNIQTGTARPIRRVISERQGFPLPRNPEATVTSSVRLEAIVYKLVQVGGKELEMIKAAVRKTMYSRMVTRVDYISNPFLWGHFVQNAKVIQNEQDLFHGAKRETIPKICTTGFDKRLAGSRKGAVYGQGCYFAKDASLAAWYMDSPNGGQMIMAKVLVGRFTRGEKSMVRPPLLQDSDGHRTFDTTVDNVTNPKTFVTYMDWQAYPMYIITLS
ncbi:unnamed protein product [Ascophyllum nodosum]